MTTREVSISGATVELALSFEAKVHLQDLERSVESLLNVPAQSGVESKQIISRVDCHRLECQRPAIQAFSVFGVIEDIADSEELVNVVNPTVSIHGYEIGRTLDRGTTSIRGPHDDWLISSLKTPCSSRKAEEEVHDILWFDFREIDRLAESMEECCNFLRSVIGTSHAASPWGSTVAETGPSVIVVVGRDGGNLASFRTGDVCPSHYVHSICHLNAPSNCESWWSPERQTEEDASYSECCLLVYRLLPPRESLFLAHPGSQERPAKGCLWERFWRHSEIEDEERIDEFFRLVAPPYISHKEYYPGLLDPLLQRLHTIQEEALSIPRWTAWPERQHYSTNSDNPEEPTWTVFPLCHCFPANRIENRKWIHATSSVVPQTTTLLKQHLGEELRTALFSRLDPETTLEAHVGWEDLANHVFRVHIPLLVPPGDLCGTWVDGCVETHEEGRPLCFDDSKIHRAFNYSKLDRIVLILDLARPIGLPEGTASGGHSEELDKFIDQLS